MSFRQTFQAILPVLTVASFAAAGFGAHHAQIAQASIEDKSQAQMQINNRVSYHLQSYEQLTQASEGWNDGLRSLDEANDVLGLFQLMALERFGLETDLSRFHLISDAPYMVSGQHIGLLEICVATQAQRLQVRAEEYDDLINGLAEMEMASDISFSSVTVLGDRDSGLAELGGVCMLLQEGGAA